MITFSSSTRRLYSRLKRKPRPSSRVNPDAAPKPAPIATERDGYEDLAAEYDTVAVELQAIGFLVVPSDVEFGMELVADAPLERAVALEMDVGVSMTAVGTNGVPKVKFVKL